MDSGYFLIPEIAKELENYSEIDKILFWEADSGENIVEYMEKALKECNIFVLFCSENSLNSRAVTDEWQAAFQLRKKSTLKYNLLEYLLSSVRGIRVIWTSSLPTEYITHRLSSRISEWGY